MPIPPRQIPTSTRTRPGHSVPRKSLPTTHQSLISDGRAEMALLGYDHSRSVPAVTCSLGIRMISSSSASGTGSAGSGVQEEERGREREEVGLEGLISDSKGRREKRATTATTLGFQLIPNPTIVALPDNPTSSKMSSVTPKKSLLSSMIPVGSSVRGSASPKLSDTPVTPALMPTRERTISSSSPIGSDEEDEDWEHVSLGGRRLVEEEGEGGNEDDDDDAGVIVLGEMELDEEFNQLDLKDVTRVKGGKGEVGGFKSYAAALGGKGVSVL